VRIAISNIAWDVAEDEAIAGLLSRHAVDAIDVAPGKYFPRPAEATPEEIRRVRDWWAQRGIELTGMQALLFGTKGLNVFGPPEAREAMLSHLDAVCRIGGLLGATRVVFGSPGNRDRSGLGDAEAMAMAVPFFERLGGIAAGHGVVICLEPVPPLYGANFMIDCAETTRVVAAVGHPAIRMQFDTGAVTVSGEDPDAIALMHADLIGHVHASEPGLVPLGDGTTDHAAMSRAVHRLPPGHLVSIEMVATASEPHPVSIERALGVAIKHYRSQ
jgi:D-psicose/D-tagatose/L-ribulose 3-epimerase